MNHNKSERANEENIGSATPKKRERKQRTNADTYMKRVEDLVPVQGSQLAVHVYACLQLRLKRQLSGRERDSREGIGKKEAHRGKGSYSRRI